MATLRRSLAIFGAAVAAAIALGVFSAPLAACSSCLTIFTCGSSPDMPLLGLDLKRGAHYEVEICRPSGCSLVDIEIDATADRVAAATTTQGTVRVLAYETKPDSHFTLKIVPTTAEVLDSIASDERWDLTLRDADGAEVAKRSFNFTSRSCKEPCGDDNTYHQVLARPVS